MKTEVDQTSALKLGDLIRIKDMTGRDCGTGIYLGVGSRGIERIFDPSLLLVFFAGRLASFDENYWCWERIV